jgi:hypothetical protein
VLGGLTAHLVASKIFWLWRLWRDLPEDEDRVSWPTAMAAAAYLALDTAFVWALVRWLSS